MNTLRLDDLDYDERWNLLTANVTTSNNLIDSLLGSINTHRYHLPLKFCEEVEFAIRMADLNYTKIEF